MVTGAGLVVTGAGVVTGGGLVVTGAGDVVTGAGLVVASSQHLGLARQSSTHPCSSMQNKVPSTWHGCTNPEPEEQRQYFAVQQPSDMNTVSSTPLHSAAQSGSG